MTGMLFLVDNADQQVMFSVESVSGTQQISLYDAGDGNHILFLPSYAELEKVRVASNLRNGIEIGGTAMTEGASCAGFALDEPYALTINGRNAGTIQFCRSANVATMFVDTASGNMLRIHEDKNYRETAAVKLYTSAGELDHADLDASLKGRGNGTWTNEKKPYALTLSANGDLLGMGAATNWILLANYWDRANVYTKLVFDFGKQVGFFWTPDCEYVDVWLNGVYSGLYLLTEKVEVDPERLAIDTYSGDFLCKIEIGNRWDKLRNPFHTEGGRTVEITAPEMLQAADQMQISTYVDEMERIILSGGDMLHSEIFDLDSWVRRYLVDEIFCNLDADLASSFFYFKDHTFYAGPLWDYDVIFSTTDPRILYAKMYEKYGDYTSMYYAALYEDDVFLQRVKEIYRTDCLPVLENMISTELDRIYSRIENAARINGLRWGSTNADLPETVFSPIDAVRDYLVQRVSFLNSVWIDGKEYCTIKVKYAAGETQQYISVEKGSLLDKNLHELGNTRWMDERTGEEFDYSKPILEDMVLVDCIEGQDRLLTASRDYIAILSIGALMGILLMFLMIDLSRRRKERRGADARTKVST